MLMATVIGFGLCASAYYIYKNQTNLSLHLLRLSLKLEDCLLKFRGDLHYYLIPDEDDRILKYSNDFGDFSSNENDVLLRQAYNINDKNCEYFIELFDINKKKFLFVKHFTNKDELEINKDFVNFKSPILSCTITVIKNNEILYKEYDITENINSFVNYNSNVELSNSEEFKKLWIYYFNYIGKVNNTHISYLNSNDIILEWNIMDSNFNFIKGNEINIKTENGACNIKLVNKNQTFL